MDKAILPVQVREKKVLARDIRRQGLIPAEYYGRGVDNVSLAMDYQTFRRLYREAGENTVIDLKIEGVGDKKVLVHNVDYHPVTDEYRHVEFINVRMDEEVTTNVPILLEGVAPAVKELAGTLVQNLDELEIRCLPGDLIHEIILNIEPLVDFHSALHVSDLVVPEKITILTDLEQTVATVQPPREDEPEEELEAVAVEGEESKADEPGSEDKNEETSE